MSNIFPTQHVVMESDQYRQLSPSAKILYAMLCKHSNRYGNKDSNNWFGRSTNELIHDTNLSNKTITKARRELVTAYMIQVEKEPDYTKHISNRYRIIPWKRVKFKRPNYRNHSPSNYRNNYTGLNKNTKLSKLPNNSKLTK